MKKMLFFHLPALDIERREVLTTTCTNDILYNDTMYST